MPDPGNWDLEQLCTVDEAGQYGRLIELLRQCTSAAFAVSDDIGTLYFTHSSAPEPVGGGVMDLRVIHETRFDYTPPVKTAQHMAHLKPLGTASQRLRQPRADVHPAPAQLSETQDVFGNTRSFFSLQADA